MAEVYVTCSKNCDWEETVPEEDIDMLDLKEDNCDDNCNATLIYDYQG